MSKTVLLIEDEELISKLLEKKLTDEGYQVRVERQGKGGIGTLQKVKPDVILVDLVLPDMSGFRILEKMKEVKELKDIPVIVISNSGVPLEIEHAKELGAKDWIAKTDFNPLTVIEKVAKQINY